MQLILTTLPGIPLVKTDDNLAAIFVRGVDLANIQLADGDILVIAQKIVSKAEGRLVDLRTVIPSQRAVELARVVEKDARFIELVLRESIEVMRTRPGTLIVQHRLGFVCANAGIDHSNVEGPDGDPDQWVLLLPENPDESAEKILRDIATITHKNIGVIIIDSHGRAWRNGIVGISIGIAGVPAVVDMRGEKDLFGYTLKVTQIAAVDELAAGASLIMGQAAESAPVVHVRGFPYPLRESSLRELIRSKEQDLFR
jgi:coenzyme F420-0:L-glutamate ligase / coenzyme F420-1:gamma-L-glutamate ligase